MQYNKVNIITCIFFSGVYLLFFVLAIKKYEIFSIVYKPLFYNHLMFNNH